MDTIGHSPIFRGLLAESGLGHCRTYEGGAAAALGSSLLIDVIRTPTPHSRGGAQRRVLRCAAGIAHGHGLIEPKLTMGRTCSFGESMMHS